MKNNFQKLSAGIAAAGLAFLCLTPAAAQPVQNPDETIYLQSDGETDENPTWFFRGDYQKPVLETYDSRPAPPGDAERARPQPLPSGAPEADAYPLPENTTDRPVDTEFSELDENAGTEDEFHDITEENTLDGERGDYQKPVLETYNSRPSPPDGPRGQQPPPPDNGWTDRAPVR